MLRYARAKSPLHLATQPEAPLEPREPQLSPVPSLSLQPLVWAFLLGYLLPASVALR